ncbi:MAG: cbb3-type cytochrome c oxidase subunit 3 [Pseudomonadota bacterium]
MTYQSVSAFSQTWGLVFLVTLFLVMLAYAFWPSNKERFNRAADSLLDESFPQKIAQSENAPSQEILSENSTKS